jgi:Rrf2 family protein
LILSGTAEYALRAIIYLAQHGQNGRVAAAEVSEALEIPANYLGKILHELARAGVLDSCRGKRGGFALAIPPEQLSLLRVVSLFDRVGEEPRCLLGRDECSDKSPCAAHQRWKGVSQQVTSFFQDTTVADLLAKQSDR